MLYSSQKEYQQQNYNTPANTVPTTTSTTTTKRNNNNPTNAQLDATQIVAKRSHTETEFSNGNGERAVRSRLRDCQQNATSTNSTNKMHSNEDPTAVLVSSGRNSRHGRCDSTKSSSSGHLRKGNSSATRSTSAYNKRPQSNEQSTISNNPAPSASQQSQRIQQQQQQQQQQSHQSSTTAPNANTNRSSSSNTTSNRKPASDRSDDERHSTAADSADDQRRHRRRRSRRRHKNSSTGGATSSSSSASPSSSSASSTASSCNGSCSSDDGDTSTSSGEPNLPYPGFPEIALKYLTQETRPRNWCLRLITNPWFERISILVILLNCITLGMYQPCVDDACVTNRCKILQIFDDIIFAFFALEMSIKMVAMGICGKNTYLADSWNRLDFFIVFAGLLEYVMHVENLNLTAIRTIRVLRPLRAINRIPSMRILVMLLLDTLPMLGNVLLLCFFVFFIFGIIGVQLWEGILRQRCVLEIPNYIRVPLKELPDVYRVRVRVNS